MKKDTLKKAGKAVGEFALDATKEEAFSFLSIFKWIGIGIVVLLFGTVIAMFTGLGALIF